MTGGAEPDAARESGRAFGEALVALRPYLFARAVALCQGVTGADDLVHDTLERALRNQQRFRAGSNLRAWTVLIMRNLFIDGWRRVATYFGPDPDGLEIARNEPAAVGPIDLLGLSDVWAAVAALSTADREIFELAHLHGECHRAIAEHVQVGVGTVGTRLFRIKAKLRRVLASTYHSRLLDLGLAPAEDRGTSKARSPRA